MPSTLTYPGVYIEERPSGVRTITGVATSIAGFVDNFSRGPLNEAVQCLGYADFEREFGGIDRQSAASYGIKQFFQNGGAECWVVRVATLDDAAPANNAIEARALINDEPAGAGDDMFRVLAGRRLRGQPAADPGTWGNNVRLDVDYDTAAPTETFNLTVSEVVVENGRPRVARTETFRNLTMDAAAPNYAIPTVNETSRIVQLDRRNLAGTADLPALPVVAPFPRPAVTGTLGDLLPLPPVIPASGATFDVTVADDTDPPVARPTRTATLTYPGPAPTTYAALRPFIEAAIRGLADPGVVTAEPERSALAGATVRLLGNGTAASPFRYVVQGGRGSPAWLPGTTIDVEGPAAADMGFPAAVAPNVQQYQLEGGLDGILPVDDAALIGSSAAKTGFHALDDVDLVNILCIPRAAELAGTAMRAVYDQAAAYMASRRGFLLIDIPETTATLDAMQTWMMENDSLRSRDAAVYFPRTFVPDPANGNRLRSIGASGTIAGLYARTDATRGVWKAPAGTDARLENVQALAYVLTDLQNGALNPLGVNCLRTFPGYSHISWGARTLDGADSLASEWKYIPIRRLALFIEESLFRGTKWVVFEPNDEPLWAQVRLNVGVFMNNLFRQGAFQGLTPQQAYFVKCDKETTTQADRNLGIVNIVVGFAPLKPAEFVVITIQQIAGDLQ
ncbi:phage tail sheath C-terminal domain-containing protein [Massilia sp. METH4]|uniref:phage tail sheath C-terminal domain-containing protein n=1 Tax=Massilia sp. METH4 TaxID=3123041 RepID=UPI0030D5E89F